jgi:aerobic carbon-monoxide dehydrogenase small subunit
LFREFKARSRYDYAGLRFLAQPYGQIGNSPPSFRMDKPDRRFYGERAVSIGRNFMTKVALTVNGRQVSGDVEDRTLLVQFLRENLNLTGTHVGCDTSQCGACVVHVDGKAVKSCTMLAAQASGSEVTTIEGLASGGELHPVQAAFKEHHGLQCGFCTPGMIMSATDMITRYGGKLDEKTVRAELDGNICRCTGYHNIVKAILAAAEQMSGAAKVAAE